MKKISLLIILLLTGVALAQSPVAQRVQTKSKTVQERLPQYLLSGGSADKVKALGAKVKSLGQKGKLNEAEAVLDQMLALMSQESQAPSSRWEELVVQGERANMGIYDLSLEYDTNGVGWMAYSAVNANFQNRHSTVETHLARTTDQGKTWTYVTDLNKATPDTLDGEQGMWWNEVPTLVHDPHDKGREWKLFYHKYFARMPYTGAKDRRLQYSWIAYRTSSRPDGPWSEEVALFGAGRFPAKPYSAQIDVSTLHPSLSEYFVLTEMGSLYHQGRLYLSIQAIRAEHGEPRFDIILLASDDHGESWRFVATPLTAASAGKYDGDGWTGSSLALSGDKVYLLVCPEKQNQPIHGHRGTVVFEFSDITRGTLNPHPVRRISPELYKGGQSDYDQQNVHGGLIFPQTDPRNKPRRFRLYRTELQL